jgi:glyoxylase-like metal-dependent hydrolase (beta-lactamase superfamily II)
MRAIAGRRRKAALAASSLAGLAHPLGLGGAIPGVEGWEWIHTLGHTRGNVAYVRSRDRVALSGDAILTLPLAGPGTAAAVHAFAARTFRDP